MTDDWQAGLRALTRFRPVHFDMEPDPEGAWVLYEFALAVAQVPAQPDHCGDPTPHEPHDDEGTAAGRYSVHTCPGSPERRAVAQVPAEEEPWYVVEYDVENHALIATERFGENDYGAASIVAHGVPPGWGHRIAAALATPSAQDEGTPR